jgi:hypothetical protein
MLLLLLIGLLLAGVLAYLLWAPMVIEIDTRRRWYGVHYGPALDAQLFLEHLADPSLVVRFLRWRWRWPLLTKRILSPTRKADPSTRPSRWTSLFQRRRRLTLPKILKLLRTFRVRRFDLLLDTDDYVLNAQLYPVSTFLTFRGWPVTVNFLHQNELTLRIENRMSRIMWALIT